LFAMMMKSYVGEADVCTVGVVVDTVIVIAV
jgi:hypothetical protein